MLLPKRCYLTTAPGRERPWLIRQLFGKYTNFTLTNSTAGATLLPRPRAQCTPTDNPFRFKTDQSRAFEEDFPRWLSIIVRTSSEHCRPGEREEESDEKKKRNSHINSRKKRIRCHTWASCSAPHAKITAHGKHIAIIRINKVFLIDVIIIFMLKTTSIREKLMGSDWKRGGRSLLAPGIVGGRCGRLERNGIVPLDVLRAGSSLNFRLYGFRMG